MANQTAAQRLWYVKHRARLVRRALAYYRLNRDVINAKRRPAHVGPRQFSGLSSIEYHRRRYAMQIRPDRFALRIRVLQVVSRRKVPACVKCGLTDVRILTINHKKGGGCQHRRQIGPDSVWRGLVAGTLPRKDYDVRCHNCNWLFEWERGRRALPYDWREIYRKATT